VINLIETLHNKIKDTIISSSPLFLSCQLQEDVLKLYPFLAGTLGINLNASPYIMQGKNQDSKVTLNNAYRNLLTVDAYITLILNH
jgi:hypothetical protein